MRASRSRPVSLHGPRPHTPDKAARKIFNCIVDETALVAGVKKSTRNGIRQWVQNGQIRLFVPLYALEQLDRQKGAPGRHGEDVRDTLKWLDEDATTKHTNIVILQGGFDTYENWAEVERFALPKGLFSENDHPVDDFASADDLPEDTTTKLTLADDQGKASGSSIASDATGSVAPSSLNSVGSSMGMISPPTSPVKGVAPPLAQPAKELQYPGYTAPDTSSVTGTPLRLRPLFNYILWRIHQELDPIAALESFIFLCNDHAKTAYAKDFDIRTKRLEQLRDAINREDREFKNRQAVHGKENVVISSPPSFAPQTTLPVKEIEVGEDPLDIEPPKAPAAMLGSPNGHAKVMDPDAFGGRTPQSMPRQQGAQGNHQNGATPRGGQNQSFRGNRGVFRGSPRGRGNVNSGRGGGFSNGMQREQQQQPQQQPTPPHFQANDARINPQIDPNSFIRPRGGANQRGGRKLWVPK
ncbi:hypothetical protein MBLNU230_g2526t1 [Neophaeotheca triangularis]